MATGTTPNPPAVVLDASVVIALCTQEAGTFPKAEAQLDRYAKAG